MIKECARSTACSNPALDAEEMHVINVTNAETIKHRILFLRHHDQLQIHQAFLFAQAGCFVNHNFWTGDALSFKFDRYVLWQKNSIAHAP